MLSGHTNCQIIGRSKNERKTYKSALAMEHSMYENTCFVETNGALQNLPMQYSEIFSAVKVEKK